MSYQYIFIHTVYGFTPALDDLVKNRFFQAVYCLDQVEMSQKDHPQV